MKLFVENPFVLITLSTLGLLITLIPTVAADPNFRKHFRIFFMLQIRCHNFTPRHPLRSIEKTLFNMTWKHVLNALKGVVGLSTDLEAP